MVFWHWQVTVLPPMSCILSEHVTMLNLSDIDISHLNFAKNYFFLFFQVSLYHITDEALLYNPDDTIGPGATLLERQQVSAYASEWIIFKGLKQIVKDWVQNRTTNHGE